MPKMPAPTTDAQVAAIAASIKEWGWTSPALVGEDGGLIAGHARVLAARQLGILLRQRRLVADGVNYADARAARAQLPARVPTDAGEGRLGRGSALNALHAVPARISQHPDSFSRIEAIFPRVALVARSG
jgi:hypothetical protein